MSTPQAPTRPPRFPTPAAYAEVSLIAAQPCFGHDSPTRRAPRSSSVQITQNRADLVLDLFEQYYTRVFCFARKSLPAESAEDIAQEVFSRLLQLKHLEDLDVISVSYLIKIADNLIKRRYNRGQRFYRFLEAAQAEPRDRHAGANPQPMSVELSRDMAAHLDSLSPREREAVQLVVCNGLSYQEAAESLGVPVSTVNNWKYRGIQKLKEMNEAGSDVGNAA
jgi:RNA polymerase sigma factor (sigma-70 family)